MAQKACRMEDRMAFIAAYAQSGGDNVSALCRQFGISRQAGYEWLERFASEGADGLRDRSHAPHRVAHAASEAAIAAVSSVRHEHPTWGPKKIRALLMRRAPGVSWPAASTIGEALRRAAGNKSHAARMLGLTRNALRYRLKQMGIEA